MTSLDVHVSDDVGYVVVHLVVQEAHKPLIESQVLDAMSAQLTPGPSAPMAIMVGLVEPVRHALSRRLSRRRRILRERAPRLSIELLPFSSRIGVERSMGWHVRRLRRFSGGRPVVLHCRSEAATPFAVALQRRLSCSGIVLDARGAWPEELLLENDGSVHARAEAERVRARALHQLIAATTASDAVLGVSDELLAWMRQSGAEHPHMACVPCCVARTSSAPGERARRRRALALDERLVFVYLGTIAPYQHVADGVAPFFSILSRLDPRAHLLALTPQPEKMRHLLEQSGIPEDRATVLSVEQSKTASYLAAGDAALLFRAPTLVNRVAQPVKLGEYLNAGLPVIITRGLGRLDRELERARAGISVSFFEADEATREVEAARVLARLEQDADALRHGARKYCDRVLRWETYVPVIRAAYSQAVDAARTRRNRRDGDVGFRGRPGVFMEERVESASAQNSSQRQT